MSNSDTIVYVSTHATVYHSGYCGYLHSSKHPMKLGDAVKRYPACSRCSPPRLKEVSLMDETRTSSLLNSPNNSFLTNRSSTSSNSPLFGAPLNSGSIFSLSSSSSYSNLDIDSLIKKVEEKLTRSFEVKIEELKNSYDLKLKQMEEKFSQELAENKKENKIQQASIKELTKENNDKDQKILIIEEEAKLLLSKLDIKMSEYLQSQNEMKKKLEDQEANFQINLKDLESRLNFSENELINLNNSVKVNLEDLTEKLNTLNNSLNKNLHAINNNSIFNSHLNTTCNENYDIDYSLLDNCFFNSHIKKVSSNEKRPRYKF